MRINFVNPTTILQVYEHSFAPQMFKSVSRRLGREERKTVRATFSLIAIVVNHLVCHSVKAVVNAYQVYQVR